MIKNFKMNKSELVLVFLCGIISALLMPSLRKSVETITDTISDADFIPNSAMRLFGADANRNDLMDIGYLTKISFGSSKRYTALTKKDDTEVEQANIVNEAMNCLKAGEQFLKGGSINKARKLFERAVFLAPSLPQALLTLGEFIEQHKFDVVLADQLYLRALTIAPGNSRAIRNRIRTKDLVASKDQTKLAEIESKRVQLSHVPVNSPSLKRIQKEAYFHHVHHTVAIEGNTMDLHEIRSILETGRCIGGKSIMEHSEVVGVDSALRYINTSMLHRVGDITLQDILNIHMRVLGHTDPPAAGRLRTTQVVVGSHIPPPPARLPHLMNQFMDWLNDPASAAMHPIRYAALAHFHLVDIHPFIDGNGRTARLLMNFLLMQAGYPPIIIRHQDRLEYYDTLEAGHEGDTRPFIRFISHCTEKTLDVYLWATQDTPALGQEPTGRHIGLGEIDLIKDSSQGSSNHQHSHMVSPNLGIDSDKVYSRYSNNQRSSKIKREIDPTVIDDLGVRFGKYDHEDERIAGPSVHKWLMGEGSEKYTRKSRYYSRVHTSEKNNHEGLYYNEDDIDLTNVYDNLDENKEKIEDIMKRHNDSKLKFVEQSSTGL